MQIETMVKIQDVVRYSLGGVVGEIHAAQPLHIIDRENLCGWRIRSTGLAAKGRKLTPEEIEQQALTGRGSDRITRQGFLEINSARKAPSDELPAHAIPGSNGVEAMEIPDGDDPKYRLVKRNRSTVVMRKTTTTYKARRVSRGGGISEDEVAFAPAPIANRGSIRTSIAVSPLPGYESEMWTPRSLPCCQIWSRLATER